MNTYLHTVMMENLTYEGPLQIIFPANGEPQQPN